MGKHCQSALHRCLRACNEQDSLQIVPLLVHAGCSLNLQDDKGYTALDIAVESGILSVVHLL
ncbi:hypothetical protein ID866_10081, partial [Astraeus odoratus]